MVLDQRQIILENLWLIVMLKDAISRTVPGFAFSVTHEARRDYALNASQP